MQKVNEIISKNIDGFIAKIKAWQGTMYNVKEYGLVGDGVTDDTAALQALINLAISEGRKTIFFPHGTYYVTSLVNDDKVFFVGDNATFTGGYTGVINQFGGGELNQNAFSKVNNLEADNPTDALTIAGGVGITISENPNTKTITITSTGTATPGPHGSAHTEFGADPIPNATTTEGGLMSAKDKEKLDGFAVSVVEFGADNTGETDSTAAIQAAIDAVNSSGGGVVFVPSGIYLISSPLVIYSKVYLRGSNYNNCILKAASGFTGSALIKTFGFDTLTGQNKWFTNEGVVHGFAIEDLQLDGNFQPIKGCEFYAKRYFIDRVLIRDFDGGGFYSEAGAVSGQNDWTDMPEGCINHLWVRGCMGVSFDFHGGHDMTINYVACRARGQGGNPGTIGAKFGGQPNSIPSCDINAIHVYGHETGVVINRPIRANLIITESTFKEALIINSDNTQISKVESYNNNRANLGTYDIVIEGNSNQIASCLIYGNPSFQNEKAVKIAGERNKVTVDVSGQNAIVEGITIEGNQNQVHAVLRNINGVAIHTGGGAGAWIGNMIFADIINASVAWQNDSGGYGNHYNIKATGSGALFSGTRPNRGGVEEVNVIGRFGSKTVLSKQYIQLVGAIDLNVTTPQAFNITHSLFAQPYLEHVQAWIIRSTNVNDFAVDWIRVNSTSPTEIVVEVKLRTASATSGAKATLGVYAGF